MAVLVPLSGHALFIQPHVSVLLSMASSKKHRMQLSNAKKLRVVTCRHAPEKQLSHVDAAYFCNQFE